MPKVAAVIVFYNPGEPDYAQLKMLSTECDHLILIDNSPTPVDYGVGLPEATTHYRHFAQNVGVATALNHAVKISRSLGCEYLFTLDQDTYVFPGTVHALLQLHLPEPSAAIVSVNHTPKEEVLNKYPELLTPVEFVMTSGNLVRLDCLKSSGLFADMLFIDLVDHEICLRLRSKGYSILRANNIYVNHTPGNRKVISLFGYFFYPSYHSPLRLYYRTRNRFHVNKAYKSMFPEYVKGDKRRFIRELIEILVFEPKKLAKIRMIAKGWVHFLQKRFGPYT